MKKITKLFTALALVLLGVFTLASCSDDYTAEDLISRLILTEDGQEVAANFTVPGSITAGSATATVTWAADEGSEDYISFTANSDGTYTAVVNRQEDDVRAYFTATLTYNKETATKQFRVKITAAVDPQEVVTNFYDAASGSSVSITGYITYLGEYSASYSNFCLYMTDSNYLGGFYAFRASASQDVYDSLSVGTAITISGSKDVYNQGHQIGSGASITIESDLTAYVDQGAYNLNEDFINDNTDDYGDILLYKTGMYVELTGATVTSVSGVSVSGSTQTIITAELGGKTFTVALNSYLFESTSSATKLAYFQEVSDYLTSNELTINDIIDVKGYLTNYNGTWQVVLVDTDDLTITKVEETAESVLYTETMKLNSATSIPSVITKTSEYEAVSLYQSDDSRVTVEWSADSEYVSTEGNVLTIVDYPSDEVVVTLKATITVSDDDLGTATDTIEFTFSLKEYSSEYDTYYNAEDGDSITVTGIVYAVGCRSSYCYAYLTSDSVGGYYVYWYGVDQTEFESKFVVGNELTISGTKAIYNNVHEIVPTSIDTVTVVSVGNNFPTATDITEAVSSGVDTDTYQGGYVSVTGVVKSVSSSSVVLTVGDNEITIYKDSTIYSSFTPSQLFVVGNTYTVSGYYTWYNSSKIYEICPLSESDIVLVAEAEPGDSEEGSEDENVSDADAVIKATVASNGNLSDASVNYASSVNLDSEVWTVTTAQNSGSSTVFATTEGVLRLYPNLNVSDGNGTSMTFTVSGGATIASIEITFYSHSTSYEASLSVTGSDELLTSSDTPTTYTIEYAEGITSFTIQCASTENARCYITSINVYFAE